jgi:hypothetical protein
MTTLGEECLTFTCRFRRHRRRDVEWYMDWNQMTAAAYLVD